MRKWLVVVIATLACKAENKPATKDAAQTLGVVAEIRGASTLVVGTRRFALRAGNAWYVREGNALVDKPDIAAAVAKHEAELGGVIDIFLGTTPIVAGGEDHHEQHVRADGTAVLIDGVAAEVATLVDGRELWRYEHEITTQVAIVNGAGVEIPPPITRSSAAEVASLSPVSRKKCNQPQILDLDAAGPTAYALVVECNDDAPVRVVSYGANAREVHLGSRAQLAMKPALLAVSKTGAPIIAGVREPGHLALVRDDSVTAHLDGVTRVVAATIADDDSVWTLTLGAATTLARDGKPIALAAGLTPTTLGSDERFGIVVLATGNGGTWLLAERASASIIVTPR
jgi:hypothetical protein